MNTPAVKVIDKRSVHQICSGQVIVTLATAVKELVENSLDAGATNIEIRLKNYGAESLEVVDNGSGVLPENFAALALKHHTSKLNEFSDLIGVETFGFRGEALSSLCALGNLSIMTCHKSQNIGARIEYDHDGNITKQNAIARTHGTSVTLLNLFATLPVRHKEFLRNIKREYTKLMQILQSYCVISTGVRIHCYTVGEKGKRTLVLATNGNNDMRENISNVFGPKQLQTLVDIKQIKPTSEDCEELGLDPLQLEGSPVFILTGFVSRCDHGVGRSANDRQYIFINKRPFDMPKLTRLVNDVYHVFNRNQYPILVLNIELSKDLVDVNVTPDKRQVFLQREKLLFATLKSSLKAMYDSNASNYEMNATPFSQLERPFTKQNSEETIISPYSKSIKERLMLAAKISENKKSSSILKFTTRKDAINNELSISNAKDNSVEDSSVAVGEKQSILKPSFIDEARDRAFACQNETSSSLDGPKNDNLPSGAKENGVYSIETNVCDDTTMSTNESKNLIGDFENISTEKQKNLTDSQIQNEICLFENLESDDLKKPSQENEQNHEDEDKEMTKVEEKKAKESAVNKVNEKQHLENAKTCRNGSSSGRELKRQRLGENQSSNKKVRIDKEYHGIKENRKSITVDFDLHKLRDKMQGSVGKKAAEPVEMSRSFRATIAPENNERAENELERHITKGMFHKMDILGQFNQGFIIAKLEDDLFIIDQHASDEKYNFEEQQKNTVIKSQRLICPQSLDLTAVNESVLIENVEIFRKNGFDFEINNEAPVSQRVKLTSLPVSRNWSFGKSDIDELIFLLSDSPGVSYRPSNIRKMFASRACRMSVMVGTSLNDGQMRRIVSHMGEIEHPWNCPHGRPTMRHLINLNMVRK